MTAAVCVDDKGGMMFNGRRQSRDRVLIDDLARSCGGALWVTPYSAPLFADYPALCRVSAQPLIDAPDNGVCFIESDPLAGDVSRIRTLILYRWNRTYPADLRLALDPAACGFVCTDSADFAGSSHDCITKETWTRS